MEVRARTGDSLSYYSRLFNLPSILLIDSNAHICQPGLPEKGDTVRIPGYTTVVHQAQPGDTFRKLAEVHQVALDALLLANPDRNPAYLFPGDQISIPQKVSQRVVTGCQPYDFAVLEKDTARLLQLYPFMGKREAGRSVLGKPLHLLHVGSRSGRRVQINASFHGNEWITTGIFMQFLNDYLLALTYGGSLKGVPALHLYNATRLSAVPMVNPDGVDLSLNGPPAGMQEELHRLNKGSDDFSGWKANIRGVDLNKQFPAKWEFEKKRKPKEPGSRDFPGTAPLTEPETKAMAALAKKEHCSRLIALHTQGREIYWGYEGLEPAESHGLAEDFASMSGYESVRYVDSFTGYKDWFIQEFRRPGFTIELGEGENPLPLSQFDEIYKDMLGLFVRALL